MDFGRISVNIPQVSTSIPKTFEENVQTLLKQKLSADDSSGIQQRKQNLLQAFDSLSGTDAKALYDRLKSRHKGDETSELFHDRLADATCNQLLKVLQKKFSSNEVGAQDTSGPDRSVNPGGIAAEKARQIELEGKLAQRQFFYDTNGSPAAGATMNGPLMQDSAGGQGYSMHASRDKEIKVGRENTEPITVDDARHVTIQPDKNIGVAPQQSSDEVPLAIPEHGSNESPDPQVMEKRGSIQTAASPGKGGANEIKLGDSFGKQETFVKPKG